MNDDDFDEPDEFILNPSHRTTEITRFEWPEDNEWWPTHSYRLGDWEWVLSHDKSVLLFNSGGDTDSYGDRGELVFTDSLSIQIPELAILAILLKLHTAYPTKIMMKTPSNINAVVAELLAPFPKKMENL